MVTLTGSVASAGAPSDLSSLQTSSSKSVNSFAEQFASVIEQFLGQSQTGSQIEIDINAAPAQASGARPFTVSVNGAADAQTPATPPANTPVPGTATSQVSATPAQPAPVSGVAWMLGDAASAAAANVSANSPAANAASSAPPPAGAITVGITYGRDPATGAMVETDRQYLDPSSGLVTDVPTQPVPVSPTASFTPGAGQAPSTTSITAKSQDPFSGAIVDSSQVPGVPPLGTATEAQWYQLLQRAGLLGGPPAPTIPGYIAPANPNYVTVAAGPGGQGGTYIDLEGKIQRDVQALVGTIATQGLTDAQVGNLLTQDITDQSAFLNGQDPNSRNIAALVSKYVKVYRNAVTLPAVSEPSYTLPTGPVIQTNPTTT